MDIPDGSVYCWDMECNKIDYIHSLFCISDSTLIINMNVALLVWLSVLSAGLRTNRSPV